MAKAKKKTHKPSRNEGGNFGPSATETKSTRGNRAVGKSTQMREWWMQQKEAKKPKKWVNRPKPKGWGKY